MGIEYVHNGISGGGVRCICGFQSQKSFLYVRVISIDAYMRRFIFIINLHFYSFHFCCLFIFISFRFYFFYYFYSLSLWYTGIQYTFPLTSIFHSNCFNHFSFFFGVYCYCHSWFGTSGKKNKYEQVEYETISSSLVFISFHRTAIFK